MKTLLNILLAITTVMLLISCNTTEPPDIKPPVLPDTTSHNFTWQKFTFGGAASSSLSDVAIIDENNIWAVGEIYIYDSTGQVDPFLYNAVHWDGVNWELKRIPFTGCGAVVYPPIVSIFGLSANNIFFARGGSIVHFDGIEYLNDCSINSLLTGSITKVWGSSSSKLYIGGENGNLAIYDGINWHKIQTGTTLTINDLWGTVNSNTTTVLAAASNLGTGDPQRLIRIINNTLDTLEWSPKKTLYTVWFNNLKTIYAGGDGLFVNKGNGWEQQKGLPNYFIFRIRGDADNNVFATGGFGITTHFNGASWRVLDQVALEYGNYESLDLKKKTIALVGFEGNAAVITIGKQQ